MIQQVNHAFNKASNSQRHVFAIVADNAAVDDVVQVYNSNETDAYWEGLVTAILDSGEPKIALVDVKRMSVPAGLPATPLLGLRIIITSITDGAAQSIDLTGINIYDIP
ncbi:MAG: hypothetical protein ACRC8S_15320 [Fimbriiglobus sp.]